MTTTRAVRAVLLDAALACAESARVTNSSNVSEQCARAARDLAEAYRLLGPVPRPTTPKEH